VIVGLVLILIVRLGRIGRAPSGGAENATSHAGVKKCPQCAEWIKIEAVKCRFCGSQLPAPGGANAAREI